MLKQFSRRISFWLLIEILAVFAIAFLPFLVWGINLLSGLWAAVVILFGLALVVLLCADYLTKCRVDIQRADPDYLIMSLFNALDKEDKQMIHNSRMVLTHILMNGSRYDEWKWFGVSRNWPDEDVQAVWHACTIDYMAPLTTWENGTIRQQICRELTNYFAVNLWCEEITQGRVSRFFPGGYQKAFKAMTKEDFRG
jgi:hypothetical protein